MHFENEPAPGPAAEKPWWQEITRYHLLVLAVASLGWLFDTMDQQLFILARNPAMRELVHKHGDEGLKRTADEGLTRQPGESDQAFEQRVDQAFEKRVDQAFRRRADNYGTWTTSVFLIGWAVGGIIFGILGDRIGRVRTMLLTILVYSLCTGLSALSTNVFDFCAYRLLSGLGVGGEFAVGVALVAEVMPHRVRPFAVGLLQGLSAVGNITAAAVGFGLGRLETQEAYKGLTLFGSAPISAWRLMFLVGALPALMSVVIARRVREPERWTAAAKLGKKHELGSVKELFGAATWRRHALLGLVLAVSGQIGLWGIGFFFPELTRSVFRGPFQAEEVGRVEKGAHVTDEQKNQVAAQVEGRLKVLTSYTSILLNIGGALGVFAFSIVTHYLGRKPTFAVCFLLALLSTLLVFSSLNSVSQIFWMIPLMGFCQLSLFGGYAIYFPELFPTRLRSTGTSFCYNVGRVLTAAGPPVLGLLISSVFAGYPEPGPHRYAGMTMCSVFLLGLLVLPFLPETKGKPLPE